MTTTDFEKVYEQCYRKALGIAGRIVGHSHAEDAVHNAAVYMLENLARFEHVTPSYFLQLVRNNAQMARRAQSRRLAHEVPIGLESDLAVAEEHAVERLIGRVRPHPRAE
jgi:DNA-directed RNA polymerase specialized sigma24 family protein